MGVAAPGEAPKHVASRIEGTQLLRHTHATLALQAGVHPKVVADRLGHYSAAFTLDVYSESIPALQESAASTVAALVREA